MRAQRHHLSAFIQNLDVQIKPSVRDLLRLHPHKQPLHPFVRQGLLDIQIQIQRRIPIGAAGDVGVGVGVGLGIFGPDFLRAHVEDLGVGDGFPGQQHGVLDVRVEELLVDLGEDVDEVAEGLVGPAAGVFDQGCVGG